MSVLAWLTQPEGGAEAGGAGAGEARADGRPFAAAAAALPPPPPLGEGVGFLSRPRPRAPAKGEGAGAGAGGVQRRRRRAPAVPAPAPAPAVHPAGVAVVGGLSMYYGIKGILKGYQQLRRRNLRHLIRTVAPALDALGATYWLDFGSLLGAHREGDVIAHDNDADICVLDPDWDALLAALRRALPQFRVFFVAPSEDRAIRWIRVLHGVGVMDLYGAYGPGGGGGSGGGGGGGGMVSIPQGHGDLCDIPSSLVFPLAPLKFRGVPVSAPSDVHAVLAFRYGADYMVPKYMDKGRDSIEQGKLYARLLGVLGKAGLRV